MCMFYFAAIKLQKQKVQKLCRERYGHGYTAQMALMAGGQACNSPAAIPGQMTAQRQYLRW